MSDSNEQLQALQIFSETQLDPFMQASAKFAEENNLDITLRLSSRDDGRYGEHGVFAGVCQILGSEREHQKKMNPSMVLSAFFANYIDRVEGAKTPEDLMQVKSMLESLMNGIQEHYVKSLVRKGLQQAHEKDGELEQTDIEDLLNGLKDVLGGDDDED